MKKSTKIVSIVLAIVMVISAIPFFSYAAAPSLTASASKTTDIKAGDEVTVTVKLSKNSGLGTLTVELNYDGTAFHVESATAGSLFDFDTINSGLTNKVKFVAAATGVAKAEGGTLFTVKFKALKAADSTMSLTVKEACDDEYNLVTVTTNALSFKGYVEESTTHEPTTEPSTDPTYPVSYSVSSVSGYQGDIVTVKVYLDSNIDLWGSNVTLEYNSDELECVGYYTGNIVSSSSVNDTGSAVKFSGMYTGNSGTVFYVDFRILMSDGTSELILSSSENTSHDGNVFSYIAVNGVVKVIKNEPTTEPTPDDPCRDGHNYSVPLVVKAPTCKDAGVSQKTCKVCGDKIEEAIPATGVCEPGSWIVTKQPTTTENGEKVQKCKYCGDVLQRAKIDKLPSDPTEPSVPSDENENNDFFIKEPSRTTIRNRDGIILHVNPQFSMPKGSYIVWKYKNSNFDVEEADNGMKLIATAKNKGWTVFTATLYDVDGNVLATDSVELYSKSGLFDKVSGFFRKLFGATKIYEN